MARSLKRSGIERSSIILIVLVCIIALVLMMLRREFLDLHLGYTDEGPTGLWGMMDWIVAESFSAPAYAGQSDTSIWEIFFSVFGLLYSIIVGLLVVEAHRRVRELSAAVHAELNAVGDICDFLRYFDGKNRTTVIQVLEALDVYVNDVVKDMTPNHRIFMSEEKEAIMNEGERKKQDENRRRHITDIIDRVSELNAYDPNDIDALDAIIKKIGDLTTFRAQKTEIARRGFPRSYYYLLTSMSLVMIAGFIGLNVYSLYLHGIFVALVTFATICLFLIIRDLDSPLRGEWNIQRETEASVSVVKQNIRNHLIKNFDLG